MADNATNEQPISDDQELAKVLAGVGGQSDDDNTEEVPILPPVLPGAVMPSAVPPAPADDVPSQVESALPVPSQQPVDQPMVVEPASFNTEPASSAPTATGELDTIKQQALGELRPLVDKLDVAPEEKFDTYLLLLRSTDDKDLIAPAHDAAKAIADEARRAQALLDIIKEIDFLSQSQK